MFPSLDSLLPFGYESVASSHDPLTSLVRSQVDKEEEEYKRKLRAMLMRTPQDFIDSKLQPLNNASRGQKASNFLTELFSAIGQGDNYVPYRDIKRREALQEYQIAQQGMQSAAAIERANAAAQAAEQRYAMKEMELAIKDQWKQIEENRKLKETEGKLGNYKSLADKRAADIQKDIKNSDIREQWNKIQESNIDRLEKNSPYLVAEELLRNRGITKESRSDDYNQIFENTFQKTLEMMRSGGSGRGGGGTTIINRSNFKEEKQKYTDPLTGLQSERPITLGSGGTTTIQRGGGSPTTTTPFGLTLDQITGVAKPNTPPPATLPQTPTLNNYTGAPPKSPLSNTQSPTTPPAKDPREVINDPKFGESRRKQNDVITLFNNTLSSTLEALGTGELKNNVGLPSLKGGGMVEATFRKYTGSMTPNQKAIKDFLKVRADDLFSQGGKNLTSNEISQIAPFWPDEKQQPEDFTRSLMQVYYLTLLNRWKQTKGLTAETEVPIDLFKNAINGDINNMLTGIKTGKKKPEDVKVLSLFNSTYDNYLKKSGRDSNTTTQPTKKKSSTYDIPGLGSFEEIAR